MFRDKEEELRRLEQQLLDAEQPEEPAEDEELLDEDTLDALLDDVGQDEQPQVYRNFSNDYGKNLRNFASGYKAYNADHVDVDLEEFSEEVRQDRADVPWLLIVILGLMAVVVGTIVWFYIRLGGLL